MTTDHGHVVHHVTCPVHEDQIAELEAENERLRTELAEAMAISSEGQAIHQLAEMRMRLPAEERERIAALLDASDDLRFGYDAGDVLDRIATWLRNGGDST